MSSYQPEADDAKLMPVRMTGPCAFGAKYGNGYGNPIFSAACVQSRKHVHRIHNFEMFVEFSSRLAIPTPTIALRGKSKNSELQNLI